jgi:DNA ligase-1
MLMLAHKYDGRALSGSWVKSRKYNGIRMLWDGGNRYASLCRVPSDRVPTGCWSRYGGVITAPTWWLNSLPSDVMLDGELYSDRYSFEELSGIVRRHSAGIEWFGIYYLVFDAPPPSVILGSRECDCPRSKDFPKGKWSISGSDAPSSSGSLVWKDRMAGLAGIWNERVRCVEHTPVSYASLVEGLEIPVGWEGWMLRDSLGLYETRRSWGLMKVKIEEHEEHTALVTGVTPGEGRLSGMVGALECTDTVSGVSFRIGMGLSDADRACSDWIGCLVDYSYLWLTTRGIPLSPKLIRRRGDTI